MRKEYIYSDINLKILYCINKALLECIRLGRDSDKLVPENPILIKCFDALENAKIDKHITIGLFNTHQTRGGKIYPRILKLTINAFKDASDVKIKSRYAIPSPLNILYYSLIIPEYPQSAAYSLASTRTLLFNLLESNYKLHNEAESVKGFIDNVEEEEIAHSTDSFTRHINIQARWPRDVSAKSKRSYVNMLVGHFLSLKGIAHFSFDTQSNAIKYLTHKSEDSFFSEVSTNIILPRFRLSNKYHELPETGEIINQLYGVPIPIKGADTVFYGGLKPSASGGLVIGLSGQAGIGKTSFALALANSLSSLGLNCFFLSTEEDDKDIRKRLFSLQTSYEKELSFYRNPNKWFFSTTANQSIKEDDMLSIIENIRNSIFPDNQKVEDQDQCNSVIVVDNLNDFVEGANIYKIKEVVENFRNLKSIVILIGGEGVLEKLKMEYLIDIGINLTHEGIDKKGEKPLRLFNLYKTRHQLSRQGTHLFHMGGNEGFRLSPQIPSQMDRKEKVKRNLHDETQIIHTLNYINEDIDIEYLPNLRDNLSINKVKGNYFKLFPRTHILVHGYGSAGKAGFSLKLLLTPPINNDKLTSDLNKSIYSNSTNRRKILIISFLYPEKYYEDLIFDKVQLNKTVKKIYPNLENPLIEYIIYYPGYISPEDFINKITRKLDKGIIEGQAFTGVLVDGLHNVFLQFIRLQENHMVWPLLYNLLARYDVTVVSTFTNFAMNDRLYDDDPNSKNKIINQALPDHMLLQQGMAPFLHALVKASDYYFFLEQLILKTGERKYLLSIKGAIGQNIPSELFEWDRQRNVFTNFHSYNEISNLMK